MVSAEKLASYSLILIGFVFLLQAIGIAYLLITIGGLMQAVSALGGTGGGVASSFSTYIIAGWAYSILQLITGLVTLIAGVAFLVQK